MTAPHWTEYAWVDDADVGVELAVCCLSVATKITVDEIIGLLPSKHESFSASHDDLDDRMMEQRDMHLVGLLQVGDAVVLFEPNGYMGQELDVMGPVSTGRDVASYYYGGHGVSGFRWYSNGELRADFEPAQAIGRDDPEIPRALIAATEEIGGFWLFDGEPDDLPDPDWDSLHTIEGSLALCEWVTGVRVTKELLRDSTYQGWANPAP